jgi:uncharacterized protein (DUF1778 family)
MLAAVTSVIRAKAVKPSGNDAPRTSLLIRLSPEDAARVRKDAECERRSVSGYLLFVLWRSIAVEQKVSHALTSAPALLSRQARALLAPQFKKLRTAIHLRCTVEEAKTIREYAARRELSISDFVAFSLKRSWNALAKLHLHGRPPTSPLT